MSPAGPGPGASAALLALADQRLPSGGHVHSGGIEQAVTDRLVHDVATLEVFLERRLRTAGLVAAGVAAAAAEVAGRADAAELIARLDAEADARMPSPAQRLASRAQGRGLLRTARACWAAPSSSLAWRVLGARPHHPVVLGCAARAAEIGPAETALAAAYLAVSAPATAAQRLLALDPVTVAALTVRLGPAIESVAAAAARAHDTGVHGDLRSDVPADPATDAEVAVHPELAAHREFAVHREFDRLPDDSDPLLDLLAERHAAREERLFAS